MPEHTPAPPRTSTLILAGAPLRDALLEQVRGVVVTLPAPPRLCIVQVGNHAASTVYIRNKLAACQRVGVWADVLHLHENQGEHALHNTLKALAHDADITAVIVQTPLPHGWNAPAALDMVPASKDIDGLSKTNALLRETDPDLALLPATPLGVMRLLQAAGVSLKGTPIAVIGKGMVVGAPLRDKQRQAGATVGSIDKDSPHPAALAKTCDVVISAAGVAGLVTAEWVRDGAVVVDVGLTRVDEPLAGNTLHGDVARMSVEGHAAVLTPVPGGVGPMTVASLMTNICDAACLQLGRPRTAWVVDAAV